MIPLLYRSLSHRILCTIYGPWCRKKKGSEGTEEREKKKTKGSLICIQHANAEGKEKRLVHARIRNKRTDRKSDGAGNDRSKTTLCSTIPTVILESAQIGYIGWSLFCFFFPRNPSSKWILIHSFSFLFYLINDICSCNQWTFNSIFFSFVLRFVPYCDESFIMATGRRREGKGSPQYFDLCHPC